MRDIAALFVEPDGIYSTIPNVDIWGVDRDARKYTGGLPVVAHPPCQLWGRFAKINYKRWGGEHNKPGNDGGCFKHALEMVRCNGGVIEHPADTYAWKEYGLLKPVGAGWKMAHLCGWVCEVWQSAYGHPCRKRTWLYYYGCNKPHELNWSRPSGTHQIGQPDKRVLTKYKPVISGKAASATPLAFAMELIQLAKGVKL